MIKHQYTLSILYTLRFDINFCIIIHLSLPFHYYLAPTVAVTVFHVTVLNSTAVEVTWRPPTSTVGINGDIRGYKLLVEPIHGSQKVHNIRGASTLVYFVTDLEESTTYYFSIVMYTVADGPPSLRLKVTMPNESMQ